MRIKFVKSAQNKVDYPKGKMPEVAIIGRSNAGKSSLINALARQKVAKVSSTPGKTRLLNFFNVNEDYLLVDMPGYGYAARAGKEVFDWQEMVEGYLLNRKNLKALLLIMDVRRDWSKDEELFVEWMAHRELPIVLVMTKADKVSRNIQFNKRQKMKKIGLENCYFVSSLKKEGTIDLAKNIAELALAKGEEE